MCTMAGSGSLDVTEVARLRAVRMADKIVGDLRKDNAPWLPVFLQARCNVDAVPIDVVWRCHHLADVNGNTQGNRTCFCGLRSVDGLLDFATPFHRIQRTGELRENTVTIRATCNPDADSWVADFLAWWIDPESGLPIIERAGVLRYYVRVAGKIEWADR